MYNLILLFLEILLSFLGLLFFYKNYKKSGLYYWIIFATIMSNILVFKIGNFYNYEFNLGVGLAISVFIAINIMIQNYGKEELTKIITVISISLLSSYLFIFMLEKIDSFYIVDNKEITSKNIFNFNLRTIFSSFVSTISSVWININLYYIIRKNKNKIWVSNTLSMLIVQFLQNLVFILFAFATIIPFNQLILIIIIGYLIRATIGLIGTGVIYIGNNLD